jgi:3-oxoacyl-[acyl-carrier protein] reductase
VNGEVVIVTGAARGLGRAYALALGREGYTVVVADIEDPAPVAAEIEADGGTALGLHVDVADPVSTQKLVDTTVERFGRIDVLVNNAGYMTAIVKRPFEEIPVDEWDHAMAVNVRGTWLCCRAAVPVMKRQRSGKIVNTSSATVASGVPGFLHYVSSKAAVVGLTRALARELGEWGICVNTVSPDYIPHDPGYHARQPEMADMLREQRCLKRDATLEDVVGTVLYLAGHGSDFVTGQDLWVNGGRLFH